MASPVGDGSGAGERRAGILVVDDRPEQRFSLSVVLSELGDVVEASSGREALRWLLRREFAVVLLDVNMPGIMMSISTTSTSGFCCSSSIAAWPFSAARTCISSFSSTLVIAKILRTSSSTINTFRAARICGSRCRLSSKLRLGVGKLAIG